MKIYKFYVKHDLIIKCNGCTQSYYDQDGEWLFYAWTTDKKIKKSFQKTRNSDAFKMEISDITDSSYDAFEVLRKDSRLKSKELIQSLFRYSEDKSIKYKRMVTTQDEYNNCSSYLESLYYDFYSDLYNSYRNACISILKDKYINALRILGIDVLAQIYSCDDSSFGNNDTYWIYYDTDIDGDDYDVLIIEGIELTDNRVLDGLKLFPLTLDILIYLYTELF